MSLPKMTTYGFWFYDEIAPLLCAGKAIIELETPGHGKFLVKANSTKLRTLKYSPACVSCDRVGVIWMLQHHGSPQKKKSVRPHLNLWALGKRDSLILMTQDHILPKSKGGSNAAHNLQTMCTFCNGSKGNEYPYEYTTGTRYPSSVDGRSPGSTGLLQVRRDAQAVLDSLEAASKLRDPNAGQNPQFRPEYRYPIGSHPAASWA